MFFIMINNVIASILLFMLLARRLKDKYCKAKAIRRYTHDPAERESNPIAALRTPIRSTLLFWGDTDDMNNQVQHFIVRNVDVEQVVNIVFDQPAALIRIRIFFGDLLKNKVII